MKNKPASSFELTAKGIVIAYGVYCSAMARENPVKNLEENQKLDEAVAQQLAKVVQALHDIED